MKGLFEGVEIWISMSEDRGRNRKKQTGSIGKNASKPAVFFGRSAGSTGETALFKNQNQFFYSLKKS